MLTTPNNVINLRNSLQSLDPFKFDAKTTYTLARNASWIDAEIAILEKIRQKMFIENGSPEGPLKPEDVPSSEFKKYISIWDEYSASEIEIQDLRLISFNDLNVGTGKGQNSISVTVIKGLNIILNDDEPNNEPQTETKKKSKSK